MVLLGDGLRSAETHTLSYERVLYPSHRPGGGVTFHNYFPPPPLFVLVVLSATKPCIRQIAYLRGVLRAVLQEPGSPAGGTFYEALYTRD